MLGSRTLMVHQPPSCVESNQLQGTAPRLKAMEKNRSPQDPVRRAQLLKRCWSGRVTDDATRGCQHGDAPVLGLRLVEALEDLDVAALHEAGRVQKPEILHVKLTLERWQGRGSRECPIAQGAAGQAAVKDDDRHHGRAAEGDRSARLRHRPALERLVEALDSLDVAGLREAGWAQKPTGLCTSSTVSNARKGEEPQSVPSPKALPVEQPRRVMPMIAIMTERSCATSALDWRRRGKILALSSWMKTGPVRSWI